MGLPAYSTETPHNIEEGRVIAAFDNVRQDILKEIKQHARLSKPYKANHPGEFNN